MTNQLKSNKAWNKKPIPCYHCENPSCSQIGEDKHWYCLRCIVELFGDDDNEVDDTLQFCPTQLEIQSNSLGKV